MMKHVNGQDIQHLSHVQLVDVIKTVMLLIWDKVCLSPCSHISPPQAGKMGEVTLGISRDASNSGG